MLVPAKITKTEELLVLLALVTGKLRSTYDPILRQLVIFDPEIKLGPQGDPTEN